MEKMRESEIDEKREREMERECNRERVERETCGESVKERAMLYI
jgi:hypothetical protein